MSTITLTSAGQFQASSSQSVADTVTLIIPPLPSTVLPTAPGDDSGGLTDQINETNRAAITIGTLGGLAIVGSLIFLFIMRRRKRSRTRAIAPSQMWTAMRVPHRWHNLDHDDVKQPLPLDLAIHNSRRASPPQSAYPFDDGRSGERM
ncbi:hypothetical protein HGRIS_002440 [Hohenbuehelia grisea]|uniref:Uncharacterized protein n=1 Tax=Hohenbuehelia grisea TaxID=104357 RepID=A0ABR3JLP5_9AGAR